MIWATVSSWSCFCCVCSTSLSLAAKNIISLILVLTTWWCPCTNVNVHSCHLLFDTSNLSWFMDLTFQVPMQYCSLQHQTLLSSPVTFTMGFCFCFGFVLHSFWSYFPTNLQEHIGHLPNWGAHLSVSYLFAFSYNSWGFSRQEHW